MFHERLDNQSESRVAGTVEQTIRRKVNHIIGEFNGLFGKVMADLIAEGQSEPLVLSVLYREHIGPRRAAIKADIERGKAAGEFAADIDPLLMIDAIIGPIYFRMLLRYEPLTEEYGDELVSQVLRGTRP
jgi:hypothetical protein